jgi:5-methylcytosine-specific restriction endonuclease McrA
MSRPKTMTSKEYAKRYYDGHKEICQERNNEWKENNKEKWLEMQRESDRKRQHDPKRVEKSKESARRMRIRQKIQAIRDYGDKCAYCGEDRFELLTVDHVRDNGAEHRRNTNTKKSCWHILCKEYDPEEYQILCMNCNMAKETYGIKPGGNIYKTRKDWEDYSRIKQIQKGKSNFEM